LPTSLRNGLLPSALSAVALLVSGCPGATSREFEEWRSANASSYEALQRIEAEGKFRIVEVTRKSLAAYDFSKRRFEVFYRAARPIWGAASSPSGLAALLEGQEWRGIHHRNRRLNLVILDLKTGGVIQSLPVPEHCNVGYYEQLFVLQNRILFCGKDDLWIYDMEARRFDRMKADLYSLNRFEAVSNGTHLYVLLNSRLLVYDLMRLPEPVAKLDGVKRIQLLGDRLVLDKAGDIQLYSPEGKSTGLVKGRLLVTLGARRLLYRDEGGVYSYHADRKKSEFLCETSAGYSDHKDGIFNEYPVLSSDQRHMFLETRRGLSYHQSFMGCAIGRWYEYVLYDLKTDRRAGKLFVPDGRGCYGYMARGGLPMVPRTMLWWEVVVPATTEGGEETEGTAQPGAADGADEPRR